jgi:hypothetical protein
MTVYATTDQFLAGETFATLTEAEIAKVQESARRGFITSKFAERVIADLRRS